MKKLFLSIVLLLSVNVLVEAKKAEEKKVETKADKELAEKATLIKDILDSSMFTSEFKKTMDATLETLAEQINLKDKTKEIQEKFFKEFKDQAVKSLTDLYTKNFSLSELKEIEKWQKTPVAKKLISLATEISQSTMQISQKVMMDVINSFQAEIQKRYSEKIKAQEKAAKKEESKSDKDEVVEVVEVIEE